MPWEFKEVSPWSEFTSERRHWRVNLNQALGEAGLITEGHKSPGYAERQGWILDLTGVMNDTGNIL